MATYALFNLASGSIKISVLLFYRRLSSRAVSQAFRWTLRITMVVIGIHSREDDCHLILMTEADVLITVIFVFTTMFLCTPISAFWNQVNMELLLKGYTYKCANEGAELVANGIISTLMVCHGYFDLPKHLN